MNAANSLQKVVVDRGGLPYPRSVNNLSVANRPNPGTQARRAPKLLANQNGPETRLPPRPGPEQASEETPGA